MTLQDQLDDKRRLYKTFTWMENAYLHGAYGSVDKQVDQFLQDNLMLVVDLRNEPIQEVIDESLKDNVNHI